MNNKINNPYHESFEHCVVSFVASVLQSLYEYLKRLLPVAFSTELIGLLECSLWCYIVSLLVLLSICHDVINYDLIPKFEPFYTLVLLRMTKYCQFIFKIKFIV